MIDRAFKLGYYFAIGQRIAEGGLLAQDAKKWITVHPNGPENKGRPALIDEESGEVLGGMGGKFNGQRIGEVKKGFTGPQTPKTFTTSGEQNARLMTEQFNKANQERAAKEAEQAKQEAEAKEQAENVAEVKERSAKEQAKNKADSEDMVKHVQNKIDDYGEKIKGARKFLGLTRDLSNEEILSKPLSKTWPIEDCLNIEDTDKAALVMALRAKIPRKPARGQAGYEYWGEKVQAARKIANKVINAYDAYAAKGTAGFEILSKLIGDDATLYKNLDRSVWPSVREVTLDKVYIKPDQYSDQYKIGEFNTPHKGRYGEVSNFFEAKRLEVDVNGKKFRMFAGDGVPNEELFSAVAKRIESENITSQKKAKEMAFDLYQSNKTGKYYYVKRGDRSKTPLMEFDSSSNAYEFLKNNRQDLADKWEAISVLKNTTEADLRNKELGERTGASDRVGDVTSEDFAKKYGFRGVQYGNWVAQKGILSRQNLLNKAYDAFADLAKVTGLKPEDVSLGGKLGFAFGARGRGGKNAALAHYEPVYNVINLTKYGGAGTVGHEWFHAFDKFAGGSNFGSEDYRKLLYASEKELSDRGISRDTVKAYADLLLAIETSEFYRGSKNFDKYRGKDYWTSEVELAARGFESYLKMKLKENGISNPFLVSFVDMGKLVGESMYPSKEETKKLAPFYDKLIAAIKRDRKIGT